MIKIKLTTILIITSLLLLTVFILLKVVLPVPKHEPNTGSFIVGTQSIELFDESRQRYIPTKVWFPIESTANLKPALWVDTYVQTGSALAKLAGLPSFLFRHLKKSRAGFHAPLDTAIITEKPLLVLSHGKNGFKELHTFMALEFASHGYFVIALDHADGAMLTVLNDGTEIPFDPKEFGDDEGLSATDKQIRVQSLGQKWAKDLNFVLTYFKNLKPEFNNKPYITGGHSTGGGASKEFCMQASDCLGIIGLDTWMEPLSDNLLQNGIDKPLLSFFSDPYMKAFEPINRQRVENFDAAMKKQNVFSKEIVISKSGHIDYCDAALLSPYSYLFGQNKGRLATKRIFEIINQNALLFTEGLITDNLSNISWPEIPEEMAWVDVE